MPHLSVDIWTIAKMIAPAEVEPTRQALKDSIVYWLAAIEPDDQAATHCSYAGRLRLQVLRQLGPVRCGAWMPAC